MADDREPPESYQIEAPSVVLDIPIRFRAQEKGLAFYDPATDGIVASYELRDSVNSELVRACLQHEGSHALLAGLTPKQQEVLVSSILKNVQARPQFVDFLQSFLASYSVSNFAPDSHLVVKTHNAIKITGKGYHNPNRIMTITRNDKKYELSAIAIIDELLAWATTDRSGNEYSTQNWKKANAATKVIEALDENTKFLLTSMGFMNVNPNKLIENFNKEVEEEYELS